MLLTDAVSASGVRRTADGYLVGEAKVARTGIQVYLGDEVGRPDMPTVRVYRPPEEVFAKDAMHSYGHRPMTNEHPTDMVTAENWKAVSIGQTGDEVVRDGEFVRVPMVLMDAAAIKDFEAGKRELSMGYTSELEFVDGETPAGEPYDAVQRDLRMNHLALVARARGGDQLRLGDVNQGENRKEHDMSDGKTTRTVQVDGLPIETTDAGAQAINRLQADVKAAEQLLTDAQTEHEAAIGAKDAELANKDAEIEELKKQVISDADLDAKVQARADLIGKAKAVFDADYSGKSDADIRKAAVIGKLGANSTDGKSDEYVQARFDILVEDAAANNVDGVVTALRSQDGNRQPQDNGQSAYETRITDAWKGESKEVA